MKIVDGALVMEHSSPEGNLGDSMGETARLSRMARKAKVFDVYNRLILSQFRSPDGYLRHPQCIWREDDTSGDMYLPWLIEVDKMYSTDRYSSEMKSRVVKNFMRYGNNNIIHPGFFAEMVNWNWLRTQNVNSQFDLFQFKYRWSDEHNKFEANETSSADYLNWMMVACDGPEWLRNRVSNQTLKEKVTSYYAPEAPFDHQWFLNIAFKFIDLHFPNGRVAIGPA